MTLRPSMLLLRAEHKEEEVFPMQTSHCPESRKRNHIARKAGNRHKTLNFCYSWTYFSALSGANVSNLSILTKLFLKNMTIFSKSFLNLRATNRLSKENFLLLCANMVGLETKDY